MYLCSPERKTETFFYLLALLEKNKIEKTLKKVCGFKTGSVSLPPLSKEGSDNKTLMTLSESATVLDECR